MNYLQVWIFLKIIPTRFFLYCNKKVLMKSQIFLIIEHATSARTCFSSVLLCIESFRETLNFCNWKEENIRSICGIKTRKFDFLLTCTKSNNVLDFWVKSQTLPFFNAYLHTYIIFGIFRTPIRYVPFCWNDGVILFPNSI